MLDFGTPVGRKAYNMIENEYVVWLTTVDAKLRPQPRPVWFVWDDGSFIIYSQAKAHKVKHVQLHPGAALHFSADDKAEQDVVVLVGEAVIDPSAPPAHQSPAYMKKYATGIKDLGMTPEGFSAEYPIAIRVTPHTLRD